MITERVEHPPVADLGIDTTAWSLIEDPIWVFDLDHYRVVWGNDAAIELWKASTLEDLQARDLSDSSDVAKARLGEFADGFAQGKTFETNWTLYPRKEAVQVRFRCRGVHDVDGRTLMLVHVIGLEGRESRVSGFPDLSAELAEVHEQLASAEARYRAFAEAGSDWLWETDEDHRFVYYSPRVVKHFGYPLDGVLGRTRRELAQVIGADPDTQETREKWAAHEADLATRRPFRDFEYAFRKSSGQVGYASISGDPVYSPAGDFKGYRGVGRDVTRRVEAEGYARQMERERDVAVTTNSVTNQFLATMSHELRTPLNAIIGFSELISSELFGPVGNPKYLDYVHDIHDSSRHLLAIVEDLLNVSRLDVDDRNMEMEPISALEFVHEAIRMTRTLAQDRSLTLRDKVPDNRLVFQGDRRALRQVMLNLISNAIKFSHPEDEIVISCRPAKENSVEIHVRDTGMGVGAEDLPHVFEPFRMINPHHANSHGGSGLGLWICKRIVDAHGGEIGMESEPDVGTTVTVTLPGSVLKSGGVTDVDAGPNPSGPADEQPEQAADQVTL